MNVDLTPSVAIFHDFFTTVYRQEVNKLVSSYPHERSLLIDYTELEKFDPDLADAMIKTPELLLNAAEEAVLNLNLTVATGTSFSPHVRLVNVPSDEKLIEQLSSRNLNELVAVKCVVTKRAEVMHRAKIALFVCELCDAEMKVVVGKNFSPPKKCDACKKFALKQVEEDSTYIDIQRAEVQELLERVRGGAPAAHIEILMEDDLVNTVAPV